MCAIYVHKTSLFVVRLRLVTTFSPVQNEAFYPTCISCPHKKRTITWEQVCFKKTEGEKKPFVATLSLFHPLSLKEVQADSSMRPLITVLKGGQSSHLARVKEFCLNRRHQRRATCTVFSLGCSAHGGSWRYFVVKYRKAVRRKTPWTRISGERERDTCCY